MAKSKNCESRTPGNAKVNGVRLRTAETKGLSMYDPTLVIRRAAIARKMARLVDFPV